MSVARLRVDINPDELCAGPRGGKRYQVWLWVFDSRTGLTVDHRCTDWGLTLKEARVRKKEIREAYYG